MASHYLCARSKRHRKTYPYLAVSAPRDAFLGQVAQEVEVVHCAQDRHDETATKDCSEEGVTHHRGGIDVLAVLAVDAVTAIQAVETIVTILAVNTVTT